MFGYLTGRQSMVKTALVGAVLACCSVSLPAFSAATDLDTSFGGSGVVLTKVGLYHDSAVATATQKDGKWVVAGNTATSGSFGDVALVRYSSAGVLDTSFGSGTGRAVTKVLSYSTVGAVAVQADGKIVLAGSAMAADPVTKIWRNYIFVVRYLASGALDTAFGSGGIVTTAVGSVNDYGNAMALQADGKIVVAGLSAVGAPSSAKRAFAAVRYLTNGALDTGFGSSGKFVAQLSTISHSEANAVALQMDGKILLAGSVYTSGATDVALVRLTSNGQFDTSFGQGGIVKTTYSSNTGFTERARAVAVRPDGKILVAGGGFYNYSGGDGKVALFQYNSNGGLDTSFGDWQGYTVHDISTGNDEANAISLAADGKIVLANTASWPSNGSSVATLSRYDSNGRIDTAFNNGGNGFLTLSMAVVGYGVAVGPTGRIVVAGASARTSSNFSSTAYVGEPLDLMPDAMGFSSLYGVAPASVQTSNTAVVSGLAANAFVPVSVSGGSYSINGGAYTSLPGWVKNGDVLSLRQTAAATAQTQKITSVYVGGSRAVNNSATVVGTVLKATFTTTTW